jgi:8-oxo-dGTP pyrophosphatase MutT (NUDIX family)
MTKIITGDRIGKTASLRVGVSAAIFDPSRDKILLTKRADNGRWCMPGGSMNPGESMVETCQREALEETGLQTRVVRLFGLYSSPDFILEYDDGNRIQLVECCYQAEITGGELRLSDETLGYGFFSQQELAGLDLMDNHRVILTDLFSNPKGLVVA